MGSCHIAFETLINFVEGKLSTGAAEELQQHLNTPCSECAEAVTWLHETLPGISDIASHPPLPSSETEEFVLGLSRLLSPERTRPGILRHIAHLLSGPMSNPAASGARGVNTTPCLYSADRYLVTLWSEPETGSGHYLIGQLYDQNGDSVPSVATELISPEGRSKGASAEGTEFHLRSVEPGRYLLRCTIVDEEILIPWLEIGQE